MRVLPYILAVAGTAGVVYLYYKKRQTKRREQDAKRVFLEHVKSFGGHFQPLYQVVSQEQEELAGNILNAWKARMAEMPELVSYLDRIYQKNKTQLDVGRAWIATWERWGVLHDKPGMMFEIDKDSERLYFFNDVYRMGAKAKVVIPAWWIMEDGVKRCIENGGASVE